MEPFDFFGKETIPKRKCNSENAFSFYSSARFGIHKLIAYPAVGQQLDS